MNNNEPRLAAQIHVFNSFFYTTLTQEGMHKVLKWTKTFDIFSKTFIVVPIHEEYVSFSTIAAILTNPICQESLVPSDHILSAAYTLLPRKPFPQPETCHHWRLYIFTASRQQDFNFHYGLLTIETPSSHHESQLVLKVPREV